MVGERDNKDGVLRQNRFHKQFRARGLLNPVICRKLRSGKLTR